MKKNKERNSVFLILMLISATTTTSQKTSANPEASHTEAHQQAEEHAQHPQASIPVKKGQPSSDPVSEEEDNHAITKKELLEAGIAGLGIASGSAVYDNRKKMRSLEKSLSRDGIEYKALDFLTEKNKKSISKLTESQKDLSNQRIQLSKALDDHIASAKRETEEWEKKYQAVLNDLNHQNSSALVEQSFLKSQVDQFITDSQADQRAKEFQKLMKQYNKERGKEEQMTAEEILKHIENKKKYHNATKTKAGSIKTDIGLIKEKFEQNKDLKKQKNELESQKINFLNQHNDFKDIAELQEKKYKAEEELKKLKKEVEDSETIVTQKDKALKQLELQKIEAEEKVNKLTKLIQEKKNQIEKPKEGAEQNQQQVKNISENDVKKQQNQPVEQEQKLNEDENIKQNIDEPKSNPSETDNLEKELKEALAEAETNKKTIENIENEINNEKAKLEAEKKIIDEKNNIISEKETELKQLEDNLNNAEKMYKELDQKTEENVANEAQQVEQNVKNNELQKAPQNTENKIEDSQKTVEKKLETLKKEHQKFLKEIENHDKKIEKNNETINKYKYSLGKEMKPEGNDEHIKAFLDKFKEFKDHSNLGDEHIEPIKKILKEHVEERRNIETLMGYTKDSQILNKINKINEKNEKINKLSVFMKKLFEEVSQKV